MFNCLRDLVYPVTWWTCVRQLQATFIDAVCVLLCVAASSFHRRSTQLCCCWAVNVKCATCTATQRRTLPYVISSPAEDWTIGPTLEHIIHTSTLVTVFTVRMGEHNFIVLLLYFKVWHSLLFQNTIRYDSVYLTCSRKLTGSQLSLPHGTNKKLKCETKNKTMSMIGPVQSRCHEGSPVG